MQSHNTSSKEILKKYREVKYTEFKESILDELKQNIGRSYADIYQQVNAMKQSEQFTSNRMAARNDYFELFQSIYKLPINNQMKNLYLLAFMQIIISDEYVDGEEYLYPPNILLDYAVSHFNKQIYNLLINTNKYEAQCRIAKVMIDVLSKILNSAFEFPTFIYVRPLNAWHMEYSISRKKPTHFINQEIVKTLLQHDKKIEQVSSLELDKIRMELLDDLVRKQANYTNDLFKKIPHASYGQKCNKLVLRLAAVDYIKEKISSGKQLNGEEIRNNLKRLFGDLVFETRWLGPSYITKKIPQLNLSAITRFWPMPLSPIVDRSKYSTIDDVHKLNFYL